MKPIKSIITVDRLANILYFLKKTNELPGDIAEFGVFNGGSLSFIAKNTPKHKQIYGIDSFEGLPKPRKGYDLHREGEFKADYKSVLNRFSEFPNVRLIKGFFPNPEAEKILKDTMFSFVHIDVDLYESDLNACRFFFPKMVKNGVMIFDDYRWVTTPGCKKAIDEYSSENKEFIGKELRWGEKDKYSHFQFLVIKSG